MKNLKRLGAAIALTFVLGLSAFAGEIETPPCAPPEAGDISTPPCAAQMSSYDSGAQRELNTPSAANTVDIVSVVDAALNLLTVF
jgi:hypothetical protein